MWISSTEFKTGWAKWMQAFEVVCDKQVPMMLNDTFYRALVRSALLNELECLAVKRSQELRILIVEMRMFCI